MFRRAVTPLVQRLSGAKKPPQPQPPVQHNPPTPFQPRKRSMSQQRGASEFLDVTAAESFTLAAFIDDLRPSRAELYSIICFALTGTGSLLCFLPFYYYDANGHVPLALNLQRNFDGSVLEQSVNSDKYKTALLLR